MNKKHFIRELYDHPLHDVWSSMKVRCNSNRPSYESWNGRGIKVCDEWNNFLPFYNWAINNGYKKGLTLDRINNNGNYEPGNCRFTTYSVQNSNKRKYHRLPRNYADFINSK
jgi:hypothetical protein